MGLVTPMLPLIFRWFQDSKGPLWSPDAPSVVPPCPLVVIFSWTWDLLLGPSLVIFSWTWDLDLLLAAWT